MSVFVDVNSSGIRAVCHCRSVSRGSRLNTNVPWTTAAISTCSTLPTEQVSVWTTHSAFIELSSSSLKLFYLSVDLSIDSLLSVCNQWPCLAISLLLASEIWRVAWTVFIHHWKRCYWRSTECIEWLEAVPRRAVSVLSDWKPCHDVLYKFMT